MWAGYLTGLVAIRICTLVCLCVSIQQGIETSDVTYNRWKWSINEAVKKVTAKSRYKQNFYFQTDDLLFIYKQHQAIGGQCRIHMSNTEICTKTPIFTHECELLQTKTITLTYSNAPSQL